MTEPSWRLERLRGSAADFHGRPLPDPAHHAIWWFEVTRPAIVLGSTQPDSVVDAEAVARTGTEVVRRRSGGGAVHLVPGSVTWVDVVLPATDPRWDPDVSQAFRWLGRAWAAALAAVGVPGADVHDGPLVRSPWSSVACFAGRGPGEVSIGGRKVVGISQRRTRDAARFQCALVHTWEPQGLVDLLALDEVDRLGVLFALTSGAAGVGPIAPQVVLDALHRALRDRPPD